MVIDARDPIGSPLQCGELVPTNEEMKRLDRARGDFFQYSDAQLYIALDGAGDPVGRIAAIRFNRHLEVYDDGVGFFGVFECVNDEAAAGRLFAAAAEWGGLATRSALLTRRIAPNRTAARRIIARNTDMLSGS